MANCRVCLVTDVVPLNRPRVSYPKRVDWGNLWLTPNPNELVAIRFAWPTAFMTSIVSLDDRHQVFDKACLAYLPYFSQTSTSTKQ
jgi:hypothetical protein